MNFQKLIITLVHAFVGWIFCTASMTIGMAVTSVENALVIHAIGAPIFIAAVSWVYFTKFNYTTPVQTATIFVAFAILMDIFVVSLMVLGNFEMFTSLLGTWIPFALMFVATYLMGTFVNRSKLTPVM